MTIFIVGVEPQLVDGIHVSITSFTSNIGQIFIKQTLDERGFPMLPGDGVIANGPIYVVADAPQQKVYLELL